jgi:hypothetical protein
VWIFFIFLSGKIYVSLTDIISSLSPPRCHLISSRRRHASFLLSQDKLVASGSSPDNDLSHRLPYRVKIEALNSLHSRRLPSSDYATPTLYCYKKIISILTALLTAQPRLHFTSSIAVVLFHCCHTPIIPVYNDIYSDKIADLLSLTKQLIDI